MFGRRYPGRFIAAHRTIFGLLTLGAVVWHLVRATGTDDAFNPVNYLSYFTIQSNIIGGAVLLWGAVRYWRGRAETAAFGSLRGAAALYLATTGVVYHVLLADVDAVNGSTPGVLNLIWHTLLPLVIVLDWLVWPPKLPPAYRDIPVWLIYPLVYGVYTLVRGPVADWYPYPFIDPRPHGYGHVALMCTGVAVWFVAAAAALVWAARAITASRARRSARPASPGPGR
ncbi:Pr6Pr family membrane protein [Actinorhabdospora filicis]|nr:Pr6Pr family membrane protein [Actinorhabdospora filicis]